MLCVLCTCEQRSPCCFEEPLGQPQLFRRPSFEGHSYTQAPAIWYTVCLRQTFCAVLQGKHIDALAVHPGTAKTAIWDKMDKGKAEGVAFDLTAKVTDGIVACHLFNAYGSKQGQECCHTLPAMCTKLLGPRTGVLCLCCERADSSNSTSLRIACWHTPW